MAVKIHAGADENRKSLNSGLRRHPIKVHTTYIHKFYVVVAEFSL